MSKHQAQFCVGPASVEPPHLPPAISRLEASERLILFMLSST